jgi:hypothetical protein
MLLKQLLWRNYVYLHNGIAAGIQNRESLFRRGDPSEIS